MISDMTRIHYTGKRVLLTKRSKKIPLLEKKPEIKMGHYTASDVRLNEAALNNLVLRVNLTRSFPNPQLQCQQGENADVTVNTKQYRRANRKIRDSTLPVKRNGCKKIQKRRIFKQRYEFIQSNQLPNKQTRHKRRKQPKEQDTVETPSDSCETKVLPPRRYYLNKCGAKSLTHLRLRYDFELLEVSLNKVNLPSSDWNIFWVRKKSTVIVITNGQPLMRSVVFLKHCPFFKLVVDGVRVKLLGCPRTVDSIKDIEVLVDIVHNIKLTDCMIEILS